MPPATTAATRSDDELMQLVRGSDDQEAFACLYDRYAQRAFGVARSICVNPFRAEEAVQEGFLSIWRARARFNSSSDGGSFGGWSMTIVRAAAIDAVRYDAAKKRPTPTAEPSETVASSGPSPEDQAIVRDEAEALRATLAELPQPQAEVIKLAFFGELSHAEIAQQLDLPAGTVKGRMRLGLEKLRARIDREG